MLNEIDVSEICQSGANIFYQSDKSFLTALQLCLLASDHLSSLVPIQQTDSDRIGFQFYGLGGQQQLVTVAKSLPQAKRKVPGYQTEETYLSAQAKNRPELTQILLGFIEKAIV